MSVAEKRNLHRLRVEWLGFVSISLAFLVGAYLLLRQQWVVDSALHWLLLSTGLVSYQFLFLWQHLTDNRVDRNAGLESSFGPANWITLIRGVFNAALAGFLLGPWPEGWLAWAPSMLYLTSSLMDFADGFVARITGRVTLLGEALDMKWDGAGMFLAVSLSVLYRQAPIPFLLVGFARYLYVFSIWIRERQGKPVYELMPSRIRRPFAGMMMGFAAIILMPVYKPPATYVAAVMFMIPFLLQFFWDGLTVTGVVHLPAAQRNWLSFRLWGIFWKIFPLIIRGIFIILLLELVSYQFRQPNPSIGIVLFALLFILALLLGAAGRVFSLAALLMTGFGLQAAPLEVRYWIILVFSLIMMLVGTGRFSLWKPEDWLIYKQAGERPSIKRMQH